MSFSECNAKPRESGERAILGQPSPEAPLAVLLGSQGTPYLLVGLKMKKELASGMGTAFSFSCSSARGRGRGLTGISGSSSSSSPVGRRESGIGSVLPYSAAPLASML